MNANTKQAQPATAVVDASALLVVLRNARGLALPLDIETTAQAESMAALWAIAADGAGVVRRRAAAALWGLGVAPGAPGPCSQPGYIVGQCVALDLDCGRCEFNPANDGGANHG